MNQRHYYIFLTIGIIGVIVAFSIQITLELKNEKK